MTCARAAPRGLGPFAPGARSALGGAALVVEQAARLDAAEVLFDELVRLVPLDVLVHEAALGRAHLRLLIGAASRGLLPAIEPAREHTAHGSESNPAAGVGPTRFGKESMG